MDNYYLFIIIASVTILSPGPGVLYTLSNAIQVGVTQSLNGILGIACGTFVIASVAATGLGLILTTSAQAFMIIKYIGAFYLIYLGIKLWHSPPVNSLRIKRTNNTNIRRFIEGALIQILNPKAIFFFMSIFPQFIDYSNTTSKQFMILILSYSTLVIIIHLGYAFLAQLGKNWIASPLSNRTIRKVGGSLFISFGLGLASTNR